MIKKIVKFIHGWRIFFFLLISLHFSLYLQLNSIDLGQFIGAGFSKALSVGMSVGVQENPHNKLAAQLAEKENRLAEKEHDLTVKEENLARQATMGNPLILTVIFLGIAALFILILLNYYLDFRRRQKDKNDGKTN